MELAGKGQGPLPDQAGKGLRAAWEEWGTSREEQAGTDREYGRRR